MKAFAWWGAASLACVFALVGCGQGLKDAPLMGLVSGTVTVDGKPAVGVAVDFYPDENKSTTGPKSTGVTDAAGKFEVSGPGTEKGAVVGFHKVTLSCPAKADEQSTSDGKPAAPQEPCTVPAKYASLDTTELSKEVLPGKNTIEIELTSE